MGHAYVVHIINANLQQRKERYLHIALPLIITVVANIIAVSSLNIAARCKLRIASLKKTKITNEQHRCRNDASPSIFLLLLHRSTLLDLLQSLTTSC
jgi:hypothetical protein